MVQLRNYIIVIALLTTAFVGLLWFSRDMGGNATSSAPANTAPLRTPSPVDGDVPAIIQTAPATQLAITAEPKTPDIEAPTSDEATDRPSAAQVQSLVDALAVEIEYTDHEIDLDVEDLGYELDRLQSEEDFAKLAGKAELPDALED